MSKSSATGPPLPSTLGMPTPISGALGVHPPRMGALTQANSGTGGIPMFNPRPSTNSLETEAHMKFADRPRSPYAVTTDHGRRNWHPVPHARPTHARDLPPDRLQGPRTRQGPGCALGSGPQAVVRP